MPLLPQAEVEALMKPWRERQEQAKLAAQRRSELSRQVFTPESVQATRLIEKADVQAGASVEFATAQVSVRKGEILLLTVEPGGNHGADSTLVDLSFNEVGGTQREWSIGDIISSLTASNPRQVDEAVWCFIEPAKDGPVFLAEKWDSIDGNNALQKWSLGETPSVFVNSSDQPVTVWTTLPATSFFVHPGPGRPVAVAWISPLDGDVTIGGRVADAHPAELDGVSFRLEHIARPETGSALLAVGKTLNDSARLNEPEPVIPVAYSVVDRESINSRLHERGDPEKPGKEVPRRWLTVFGGREILPGSESGRRELAAWLTEHPLLAHFNRRRLSAEELRDSLLTVSGQIDLSPAEAHPFPAESTWTFSQHAPFNAVYETNRRSAFMMVQRQRRHPFLALFDGADPNASTPTRQTTTVPTQALYFINDPFFHEQAERLSRVVLAAPNDESRLSLATRTLFQREPSMAEQDRLQRFLSSYPGEPAEKWAAVARVMLASNEFLYVE